METTATIKPLNSCVDNEIKNTDDTVNTNKDKNDVKRGRTRECYYRGERIHNKTDGIWSECYTGVLLQFYPLWSHFIRWLKEKKSFFFFVGELLKFLFK